jgi:hypothetical protein
LRSSRTSAAASAGRRPLRQRRTIQRSATARAPVVVGAQHDVVAAGGEFDEGVETAVGKVRSARAAAPVVSLTMRSSARPARSVRRSRAIASPGRSRTSRRPSLRAAISASTPAPVFGSGARSKAKMRMPAAPAADAA